MYVRQPDVPGYRPSTRKEKPAPALEEEEDPDLKAAIEASRDSRGLLERRKWRQDQCAHRRQRSRHRS